MNLNPDVWTQILVQSFFEVWINIAQILPGLLIALVVLLVGWFIGKSIGRGVAKLVTMLKIDDALHSAGFDAFLERGGYQLNGAGFVGALVKWFIFLVFLVAALDMLSLDQVNDFIRGVVLGYLPQVIVATLILLVAAVLADVVHRFVMGLGKTSQIASAEMLATVAKGAVWVFAILAALNQLGIAQEFVQILFTGFVVAVSLAAGLAFGLGGKDTAARLLGRLEKSVDGR